MAEVALQHRRPDLRVTSAGTLVLEGLPISWRTRAAFDDVGLPHPRHLSLQARTNHLRASDLVIGLAPEHVRWVRREHPEAAARTGSLVRLARAVVPQDAGHQDLAVLRDLAMLDLANVELTECEEVVDPGGGEVEDFVACAREIVTLVDALAERL
jgi:protein-tyrosine-phosphatase